MNGLARQSRQCALRTRGTPDDRSAPELRPIGFPRASSRNQQRTTTRNSNADALSRADG